LTADLLAVDGGCTLSQMISFTRAGSPDGRSAVVLVPIAGDLTVRGDAKAPADRIAVGQGVLFDPTEPTAVDVEVAPDAPPSSLCLLVRGLDS
jgi:hypothetical protein